MGPIISWSAAVNVKSEYSRDMPTLSINDADDIRMEDVIKDFLSQDDKVINLTIDAYFRNILHRSEWPDADIKKTPLESIPCRSH